MGECVRPGVCVCCAHACGTPAGGCMRACIRRCHVHTRTSQPHTPNLPPNLLPRSSGDEQAEQHQQEEREEQQQQQEDDTVPVEMSALDRAREAIRMDAPDMELLVSAGAWHGVGECVWASRRRCRARRHRLRLASILQA